MNNTTITAKNTFGEGLVMDFAPDNTLANVLTSALNATLLTFNGNEMSLQNDMGNGRVETARLPEGFVPIGTCEFGDIIYIVSYNPLTNKSLIGCFPSPERNISSDELFDTSQKISYADFQKITDGQITGELINTRVKKVLVESDHLHPGDKYIVYTKEQLDVNAISNCGRPLDKTIYWPKLVKFRIVSIDDSNKITYLDDNMKKYLNGGGTASTNRTFHIKDEVADDPNSLKPDLDSYRNLVSSAYSIFPKNAGKLALLAELETITGFNCAYSVNSRLIKSDESTIPTYNFDVYLHTTWTTDSNDINPVGISILKSAWNNTNDKKVPYPYYVEKDSLIIEEKDEALLPFTFDENNIKYLVHLGYSRIYYPESKGVYNDFVGININPPDENTPKVSINDHKTSYNYFINDDLSNDYVGWGQYMKGRKDIENLSEKKDKLIKITNILQLTDNEVNLYRRDSNNMGYYYFNSEGYNPVTDKYYSTLNDGTTFELAAMPLYDDVVNNYFKKDISFKIATLSNIKINDLRDTPKLSNLVWNFTVAPCMAYGVLSQYAVDLSIDFSKIFSNTIKLTNWKYHISGDVCTLTYGLDVQLNKSKKIKKIVFLFYDTAGLVCTFEERNKTSYSGVFTELLGLNGNKLNYKMKSVTTNNKVIAHPGLPKQFETLELLSDDDVIWNESGADEPKTFKEWKVLWEAENKDSGEDMLTALKETNVFENDAGILYPSVLYKILISVVYGNIDGNGDFITEETKYFTRWLWANSMYNDYYYVEDDFDQLPLKLSLANTYKIQSTKTYLLKRGPYINEAPDIDTVKYSSLGALVTFINQDGKSDASGNLNLTISAGLKDSYNTFALKNSLEINNDYLTAYIGLGRSKITGIEESTITSESGVLNEKVNLLIDSKFEGTANYGPILNKLLTKSASSTTPVEELWENENSYLNYKDSFKIDFIASEGETKVLTYINPDNDTETNYNYKELKYTEMYTTGVNLVLTGIQFNKLSYNSSKEITGEYPIVLSLIRSSKNRDKLNISYDESAKLFYFNKVLALNTGGKYLGKVNMRYFSNINESKTTENGIDIGNSDDLSAKTQRLVEGIHKLGFDSPIILTLWCDDGDNNRIRWKNIGDSHIDVSALSHKWERLNVDDRDCSERAHIFLLGFYNAEKAYYLCNDFTTHCDRNKAILASQKHTDINQISDYNKYVDPNTKDTIDAYRNKAVELLSLCLMTVNILSGIYYQSAKLEEYNSTICTDLCFLQDFSEIWSKHIIVILEPNETLKPDLKLSDLVVFANNKSLTDYIELINSIFNNALLRQNITVLSEDQSSDNNITLELEKSELLIDFLFAIPYSSELIKQYLDVNNDIQCLIYFDSSKTPVVGYRNYADALYYKDKNNKLLELTKDYTFNIKKSFEFNNNDLITSLATFLTEDKGITIPNLGKFLSYDKDHLFRINNYPYSSMCGFGNALDKGDASYYNFSMDAMFTMANPMFSKK